MISRVQVSRQPAMAVRPQIRRSPVVARAVEADKVLEDVRGIIVEQLGKGDDEVQADSKFVDLGADSLDTVEIMMALEEKFDLELADEGAEKITTVQEAAEMIAKQIESKA